MPTSETPRLETRCDTELHARPGAHFPRPALTKLQLGFVHASPLASRPTTPEPNAHARNLNMMGPATTAISLAVADPTKTDEETVRPGGLHIVHSALKYSVFSSCRGITGCNTE